MIRNKKLSIGICILLISINLFTVIPVLANDNDGPVLYSTTAACYALLYNDFFDLAEASDVVALVNIIDKHPGEVQTMYTAMVKEAIHGVDEGDSITIEMGGVEGRVSVSTEGTQFMQVGESYLIFARQDENGICRSLQGPTGRFVYQDGMVMPLIENSYICPNPRDAEELIEELEEFLASKN